VRISRLSEEERARGVVAASAGNHAQGVALAAQLLGIRATVLEVSRGLGSHVEVRPTHTPWRRHLDDARALALTEGVPDQVRRDVVPGFCRMALEAACIDVVRRRELADGRPHEDVEVELASATRLLPLLALTLFGDSLEATASRARPAPRRPPRWSPGG
jgi:hypothetical protein